MAFTFDDRAGRYRNGAGRFVSEARVRAVIDDIADAASERLAQASARLLAGDLSLAAWQIEAQQIIRTSHVAAAMLAHGGAEQMSFAKFGAIGPVVKSEYLYLRQFAEQIADGRQPLNGSLTARARQYGQASRAHFERIRTEAQQQRGFQSCRNRLHAGESCSQCKAESARGWVAIGDLVPVGQRICRAQCKCSVEFRREPADVEVAA